MHVTCIGNIASIETALIIATDCLHRSTNSIAVRTSRSVTVVPIDPDVVPWTKISQTDDISFCSSNILPTLLVFVEIVLIKPVVITVVAFIAIAIVVNVDVVIIGMPVVVKLAMGIVVKIGWKFEHPIYVSFLTISQFTRVVTVPVVGGVEVAVVVLDIPGSQMLKFQKFVSFHTYQ